MANGNCGFKNDGGRAEKIAKQIGEHFRIKPYTHREDTIYICRDAEIHQGYDNRLCIVSAIVKLE